jgi:hypothetical protein
MRGIRRVDCSGPGIRRKRRGRGFVDVDERSGEDFSRAHVALVGLLVCGWPARPWSLFARSGL